MSHACGSPIVLSLFARCGAEGHRGGVEEGEAPVPARVHRVPTGAQRRLHRALFSVPDRGCKRDTHWAVARSVLRRRRTERPGPDAHEEFRGRMPAGLLPIGCDPGGNQICLVCSGKRAGGVLGDGVRGEHGRGEKVGGGTMYRIADGLGDFFTAWNRTIADPRDRKRRRRRWTPHSIHFPDHFVGSGD